MAIFGMESHVSKMMRSDFISPFHSDSNAIRHGSQRNFILHTCLCGLMHHILHEFSSQYDGIPTFSICIGKSQNLVIVFRKQANKTTETQIAMEEEDKRRKKQ